MVTPNIALRGTNNMTFWTDQISCFSKNVKFLMVRKIDRFPTQGKPLRTNAPALWGLTKWQMPGGMVTLGVTRAISVNFMDLKHKLISGKYYRGAKRSKLLFTVSRGFPKHNWKVLFCFREKITNWSRTLPEYGVDKMESGNSKHDNALVISFPNGGTLGHLWGNCSLHGNFATNSNHYGWGFMPQLSGKIWGLAYMHTDTLEDDKRDMHLPWKLGGILMLINRLVLHKVHYLVFVESM